MQTINNWLILPIIIKVWFLTKAKTVINNRYKLLNLKMIAAAVFVFQSKQKFIIVIFNLAEKSSLKLFCLIINNTTTNTGFSNTNYSFSILKTHTYKLKWLLWTEKLVFKNHFQIIIKFCRASINILWPNNSRHN